MNFCRNILTATILSLCVGCPTYDSKLSGTFREETSRSGFDGEATAIDLFRFGDNVQALVRYYRKNANPFESESRCVWSNSGPFTDEQNAFEIPLIDPRERISIRGEFDGDDRVMFSFSESDEEGDEVPFIRVNESPDKRCDTIADTLMTANFDFDGNEFAPGLYEFRNPVFVVLWLGVEPIQSDAFTTFAKTQRIGPRLRLGEAHLTDENRGLRGVLHFYLPPPDPVVLTSSGTTRFTIGHFAVVDDDPDDTGDFDLNVDEEPIAAAAVRFGTVEQSPPDTNNFGKAILFVEDDLFDLDPAVLERMQGVDRVENSDQHFFVVDTFGRNGDIKQIVFSDKPDVEINVLVTEDYLSAEQIQLPRLLPFTQ